MSHKMNIKNLSEKSKAIKEFKKIPGVGDSIANDLWLLGFSKVSELQNQDPENLYEKLQEMANQKICRCMLYVFRCAVYFSKEKSHDPEKLKWWYWRD